MSRRRFHEQDQDEYQPDSQQLQIARQISRLGYQDYSQSRQDLQEQIAGYFPAQTVELSAHQSFDMSSFAESKNAPDFPTKHLRQNFPHSNAPTLNGQLNKKSNILIKDQDEQTYQNKGLNNRNNTGKSVVKDKGQLTTRNNEPIKSMAVVQKLQQIQEQNQNLRHSLQQKEEQSRRLLQKLQQIEEQNVQLSQKIKKKDSVIIDREQKIRGFEIKFRQLSAKLVDVGTSKLADVNSGGGGKYGDKHNNYRSHNGTTHTQHNGTTHTQHSQHSRKQNKLVQNSLVDSQVSDLDLFSPQLMSPEECLQLFQKLVLKLDKSHKIRRKIGKQQKIRQILLRALKQE